MMKTNINQCPICRQTHANFKVQVDKTAQNQIKERIGKEAFDKAQKELEKENVLQNSTLNIPILYGNAYELLKKYHTTKSGYEMKHNWSMFVKLADNTAKYKNKVIEKVKYTLHPTFRNPERWAN